MKSWLLAWTLFITGLACAANRTDTEHYLKAFEAARKHRQNAFDQESQAYGQGPLQDYLEFAWLYYNLKQAPEKRIQVFLQQKKNVPVSRLLRQRWLQHLGHGQDWAKFLQYWNGSGNLELRCYELRAEQHVHRMDSQALQQHLESIWLNGRSLPKACDPLLRFMRQQGWVTQPLIWKRFVLSMETGETRLARWLASQLRNPSRARAWLQTHGNLNRLVRKALRWPADDYSHQILLHELNDLAVRQPEPVRTALNGPLKRFLTTTDREYLLSRTALFAATDDLPQASAWLEESLKQQENPQLRRWALRLALAQGQWWQVLQHYESLPSADQQDNQWLYWKARALQATGQTEPARHLLMYLSRKPSYYGFLAADRLKKPYNLCLKTGELDLNLMQELLDAPPLQRALALRKAGQMHYANLELQTLQQALDETHKTQLGLILSDEGWHAAAIRLLASQPRRYLQRFPLAYQKEIEQQARKHHLPASLIHALIRAESAHDPLARSAVGARGLMQIMPAIGRQWARKHRLMGWKHSRLEDPLLNISLGSEHLANYLQRFQGHPLPAIAAYNAGPEPVTQWLQRPVAQQEPLIWMENIPYGETREYLRKILAFRVVYQWRIHQRSSRISAWLKPLNQPFDPGLLLRPGTIPVWCQESLPMPFTPPPMQKPGSSP